MTSMPFGGEHPEFTRNKWEVALEQKETLLSYWRWVSNRIRDPRDFQVETRMESIKALLRQYEGGEINYVVVIREIQRICQ